VHFTVPLLDEHTEIGNKANPNGVPGIGGEKV
jgi:hypothetical protein